MKQRKLTLIGPRSAIRSKPGISRGQAAEDHDRYGEVMRFIRNGQPRNGYLDSLKRQVNGTSRPLTLPQLRAVLDMIEGGTLKPDDEKVIAFIRSAYPRSGFLDSLKRQLNDGHSLSAKQIAVAAGIRDEYAAKARSADRAKARRRWVDRLGIVHDD